MRYAKECQRIRELTRDAARECFGSMLREFSGEAFYGFVLYIHDSCYKPVPSASTENGFREREHKIRSDQQRIEFLREHNIDLEEHIMTDARWSPFEWEHECYHADDFDPVCRYIDEVSEASDGDDDATNERQPAFMAAFAAALRDLDYEGLFSKRLNRKELVLFGSIADSFDAVWYENTSAKLLNPPDVYDRFHRECIQHLDAEGVFLRNPWQKSTIQCQADFDRYMSHLSDSRK